MAKKTSRREFLYTAGGGIAAVWGGLRISAGPPAFGQAPPPSGSIPQQQFFVYGSAFYRPPNPPASQRRAMLKTIAQEYKFNTIRIYSPWVYNNPQQDRFDFSELEEVLRYCDEFGIKVLMGAILEDAPYWLEAAHPETRYVNALGQEQRLQGSGNNVSGGWPGLCLDWDPAREAAARYLREMAKTVSAHSSMYAYDVWNEPHIEPAWGHHFSDTTDSLLFCYCPKTIAAFQQWLVQRYGTLDRLNEAWVRRYPSFSVIDAPRDRGTYMDWVDWRRFIIDRNTAEMRFRVENLRAVDSRSLLESHAGRQSVVESIAVLGINTWRLAEVVETWGLSNFPRWDMAPPYVGAAKLELTRCNAQGKPFWMSELQGGHGSDGLWRSRAMRPRDIRLWNWMAVATGAKGILYWTYDTEATGSEATGFGLVARDGSPTERVLEAADDNRLIQTHWDIIKAYQPKPQVALLFDQDNALLTFAMSASEAASTESFRGYYKALWNCDLWADFIEPKSLPGCSYKIVIAPWHVIGKKETCAALREYVEGGGTLLLETSFGMFDDRMFFNPVIPPYGLDESFGYREGESYYIEGSSDDKGSVPQEERVYTEGSLEFTHPIAVTVKAHTFLTPLTITSATVLAKYGATPVAAMKNVGRGHIYYFGTNLGASIEAGDRGGIDLLRAIVAGIVTPPVTAQKVRPRLMEGTTRSLLVVFNDSPEDQTASIMLPSRYLRATDLHSGTTQAVKAGAIQITVPFEGVSVLRLE